MCNKEPHSSQLLVYSKTIPRNAEPNTFHRLKATMVNSAEGRIKASNGKR